MKALGAVAILTTIAMGLSSWGLIQIVSSKERITKLETEEKNSSELLKEVRNDVKEILKRLK